MCIMPLQKERACSSSEALSLRIYYIPSSVHYMSLKLSFLCVNFFFFFLNVCITC